MMSLIDLDDDQRWVPTHVNVTVLRARELRTKGKHGSRYLYTIIQVGKEKYTTGLVEKAEMPEWNEECCFELLPGILEAGGRRDYPPGSGDLVLTVMHRVLIGLDVFLGQAIVPLDKIFDDGICPRDEWLKLHSRVGRKEKERGELQTTVQFTRNNMTASMFDLTLKDKPRSAFGKLKDRVTGRKRGDVESSSAIVPGRFAALSGSLGQPFGEGGGGGGGGEEITRDVQQAPEEKRSKMKDFFKGKLRRSDDSRSCSSLASESSMSSVASENPPPSLDLLADPPSSPIYSPKVKVDSHYGETDLAKKVLTTQHTTKVLTHKRAFSDEASRITTTAAAAGRRPAMESIMGLTQSKSSLCINGSHVYDSEPCTPMRGGGGGAGGASTKLVLLEKCSPLSRSLQNLAKRGGGGGGEDKGSSSPGGEGPRRWSFDKGKKEDKEEGSSSSSSVPQVQSARIGACPTQPGQAVPPSAAAAVSPPDKGKKMRKTLFSTGGGRSDSLPAKSEHGQAGSWAPEGRLRGWFGSGDSQNKPRLEGSPKVESSSDALPPPLPPRSPIHHPQPSSPSASPTHIPPESHGSHHANNPFTPSPSPSPTPPISPSNPFLPRMQRNPFFVELIAEESRRSPPLESSCPPPSSGSSLSHCTALPPSSSRPCIPMPTPSGTAPRDITGPKRGPSIRRERPRAVARQVSLPAVLPRPVTPGSLGHFTPRSMSDSGGEQWDDSFDAFASSRLNAPTGALHHQMPLKAQRRGKPPDDDHDDGEGLEPSPPPLPPRRPLRSASSELYSNSWLHRGQELAVQKEACLLSQTGAASRQRAREEEQQRRRNTQSSVSPSPDPPTASETSESLSGHSQPNDASLTPSSGLLSDSDKLKKFKYEPLEDDVHCWKGMLFEQDLYGRIGSTGSYGEPRVNNALLSVAPEEPSGNQIASKSTVPSQKADITGPIMLLNSELTVADLLSMSTDVTAPKSNSKALSVAPVTLEPVVYSPPVHPPQEPTSANNNISYSLTLEDLNMNVNNCLDFSFIDSEGSTPSETTADTLRGLKDLGESFPQSPEDSHVAVYHEGTVVTPENMFALNNTTSGMNSSLVDMSVSPDKIWPVSPVSEEGTSEILFSSPDLETEPRPVRLKGEEDFRQTDGTFDGNGNAEVKLQTASHQIGSSSFSGVLSARLRPKGVTQEVRGDGSPCSQSKKESDKCNGVPHPVRRISESGEGPFSYQPANSSHSSSLTLDKESSCVADNSKSVISSLESHHMQSILNKTGKTENSLSGQSAAAAFEDLHARVAPNATPSKSKIGRSLQDPAPPPPSSVSIPSTAAALLSLSSDSINAPPPANHHPHPVPPGLHPLTTRPSADTSTTTTTTTLALALVRAALSSSSSSSYSSSTAQSLVDARHTLLPEETQPASSCYLPLQESSPHPVKPLTSTTTQPEKKEGRSVLEKLKSTIHPGRAAQQSAAAEADKTQEATTTADLAAQYQSLTNMELISLLLQQEMDMQKQQAASEEQAALLSKRDAELRKVKMQVRDLEDYIDNLLLRIMEQTPTLLQVRGIARHK